MKTVLISSLKGGTGKSTISCALAKKLAERVPTVLIDADIDSPNIPEILSIDEKITVEPNRVKLVHLDNLDVFSFALITDRPVSMRSEEYLQFLIDLMNHAEFNVDTENAIFVIDCPAGASDLFRGVVEAYADSLVGNVVVMTPSTVTDANKMIRISKYFGVPVLGVVNNMAKFKCTCGREHYIFGRVEQSKVDAKIYCEVPMMVDVKFNIDTVASLLEPVVKDVITAQPEKVTESIKDKLHKKVPKKLKEKLIKVIVTSLARINNKNLSKFVSEGFGGNILELLITDKGECITQLYLKLTPRRLLVLRSPDEVDITICAEIRSLLNILESKTSIEDAVMMGEIEIYGSGGAVRAMAFLQKLWDEMAEEIKKVVDEVR